MTVEVIFEDPRWQDGGIEAIADRGVRATLSHLGMTAEAYEIAILACDDARISELNAGFRDKAAPTNVLSWPSQERASPGQAPAKPDPGELGDIAIAFETCAREAEAMGKSLADHATHLICHGTLHLLGYDHETPADADLMETAEIAILKTLGISNPYEMSFGQD